MSTLNTLLESLNKSLNLTELKDSEYDILQLTEDYFLETDITKFSIILSNKVIEPLSSRINELEELRESLGSSRSHYKERRKIVKAIESLLNLRNTFFDKYAKVLVEDVYYLDYYNNKLSEISKIEQGLFQGNLDDDSLASILYPTYFDSERIETFAKTISSHFSTLYQEPKNHEYVKNRIVVLHNKLQESIGQLDKTIDKTNSKLSKLSANLKNIKDDDTYQTNEGNETVDLRANSINTLSSLSLELENLNTHKEVLKEMLEELNKKYPFLSQVAVNMSDTITVFGDSNFERVKGLANALKSNDFVSFQFTVEDLIEMFTISDVKPTLKINLTNGTLNDFGYLISKMRPFFIDSISNKSNYAQWWSERFTFNLKGKSKKNVSNMISAVQNDGSRNSHKKQTIKNIIKNLDQIPQ